MDDGRRRGRGAHRDDRRARPRRRRRRASAWRPTTPRWARPPTPAVGLLPDALAKPMTDRMALDRLGALHTAVKAVRRGGTVSLSGVYGGEVDPMPLMEMFDRGITMRMGQCHVKRWIDDILPLVLDDADPLGTLDMTTHHLPLEQAPHGLRDLPEEAGRLHQGGPQPVTTSPPVAGGTVLVTGASSGIGRATAHQLAGLGAHAGAGLALGREPGEAAPGVRRPRRRGRPRRARPTSGATGTCRPSSTTRWPASVGSTAWCTRRRCWPTAASRTSPSTSSTRS